MKYTNKTEVALIECHIYLDQIIKNMDDKWLQLNNLLEIKEYKTKLPRELYQKIEQFIEDNINPIVYDASYFDYLRIEEYGSYNADGHFIISNEHSLEMIELKKTIRILELLEKLSEFVYNELHLDYND